MIDLRQQKQIFEAERRIYDSVKLTFHGADSCDVYNPSVPFSWGGKVYLFGRVEKREEWARSWVRLFERSGQDDWTVVPGSATYQLEDPAVSVVDDMLVLAGTHVRYSAGRIESYCGYFYRGTRLDELVYFTTGPERMKDIRVVEMADGTVGVFSRPRGEEVRREHGCESVVGFAIIGSLDDLCAAVVAEAPPIPLGFAADEWGGCSQAYLLDTGLLGVIGHRSCLTPTAGGVPSQTYVNISFVLDPVRRRVVDSRIIGTRACYPDGPAKTPALHDCAFTAGIVMREDGKADLYGGIGDCEAGRITIDNPFEGFGRPVRGTGEGLH